ncbi:uncharacterized protein LOC116576015 [Mustela erminea]|uniref:uncharacterized protein LOC116576015 n=1 Tax=Mustela erminea TaxID=36723 RepID=UPI0013872870|nr:uncharacterized protein LOC116576015 [Mustela erminea]
MRGLAQPSHRRLHAPSASPCASHQGPSSCAGLHTEGTILLTHIPLNAGHTSRVGPVGPETLPHLPTRCLPLRPSAHHLPPSLSPQTPSYSRVVILLHVTEEVKAIRRQCPHLSEAVSVDLPSPAVCPRAGQPRPTSRAGRDPPPSAVCTGFPNALAFSEPSLSHHHISSSWVSPVNTQSRHRVFPPKTKGMCHDRVPLPFTKFPESCGACLIATRPSCFKLIFNLPHINFHFYDTAAPIFQKDLRSGELPRRHDAEHFHLLKPSPLASTLSSPGNCWLVLGAIRSFSPLAMAVHLSSPPLPLLGPPTPSPSPQPGLCFQLPLTWTLPSGPSPRLLEALLPSASGTLQASGSLSNSTPVAS